MYSVFVSYYYCMLLLIIIVFKTAFLWSVYEYDNGGHLRPDILWNHNLQDGMRTIGSILPANSHSLSWRFLRMLWGEHNPLHVPRKMCRAVGINSRTKTGARGNWCAKPVLSPELLLSPPLETEEAFPSKASVVLRTCIQRVTGNLPSLVRSSLCCLLNHVSSTYGVSLGSLSHAACRITWGSLKITYVYLCMYLYWVCGMTVCVYVVWVPVCVWCVHVCVWWVCMCECVCLLKPLSRTTELESSWLGPNNL